MDSSIETVGADEIYEIRGVLDETKRLRQRKARGQWLPDGWEWKENHRGAPEGAVAAWDRKHNIVVYPRGRLALWELGSWDNLQFAVHGVGAPKIVFDMVFNKHVIRARHVGITGGTSPHHHPNGERKIPWHWVEGDLFFVQPEGVPYLEMERAIDGAKVGMERGETPSWRGPIMVRRGGEWIEWEGR